MDTLPVSRRQILTLAGLTLGAGVIEFAGLAESATAAPADQLALQPIADDPIAVLSGDGAAATALPRQLAVRVVRTVDLPVGARIAVTFDPRIYSPLASAVVARDGRAVAADKSIATDPDSGLHTCTIALTESVPATGNLIVVVGTARPLLYPYDLVRRPPAPAAELRRSPRAAQLRRQLQPVRPSSFGGPARPWGVELDGVWSTRSWGENGRYRYYVPARVTLRGVGPASAPADASFSVSLDRRLAQRVTIASAQLNNRPYRERVRLAGQSRTASTYQTRWRVPAGLAPGDVLDLYLDVVTTAPTGSLAGVKHPVVGFISPENAVAQRRTGKETLTRTDSVCGEAAAG